MKKKRSKIFKNWGKEPKNFGNCEKWTKKCGNWEKGAKTYDSQESIHCQHQNQKKYLEYNPYIKDYVKKSTTYQTNANA